MVGEEVILNENEHTRCVELMIGVSIFFFRFWRVVCLSMCVVETRTRGPMSVGSAWTMSSPLD